MDNKLLAKALSKCESEEEVVETLREYQLWDNSQYWRAFGDNDNNWSTIGNQQSDADSALVEKIVNSVDALLMKECLTRGIEPTSDNAPKSIALALERFFGIVGGKIQNLTNEERTKLAQKNIILTATGRKKNPNITIIDKGEGQTPNRMPDTILSINKSNKLKVPFVQGKFNMGGTGVLCFCGEQNFQLIISKRCPDIPSNGDDSHNLWGFTIIRRERPTPENGLRSSRFTYLTDKNNNVFTFKEDDGLDIIPSSEVTLGKRNDLDIMKYGMYCKLFEYKLPAGLKSNINLRLYSRLSILLPNLAYPVYLDECREGFRANTFHRTLSGLNVRLSDQMQKADESNIQDVVTASFNIEGQQVDASVYVFKKRNKNKEIDLGQYRANEGILLVQNGQTHGSYDRKFYARNTVGLSYLAEYLLTIVDCTKIDEATREELFMNSRDRTRSSLFATNLEKNLEEFLKENATLKQIQQQRREEAIADKLDDEKPLEEVLTSVFKSSSVLSRLFMLGKKLQNPINLGTASVAEKFIGKYNPTYFLIIGQKEDHKYIKEAQLGRKFRVRLKTDAENSFFTREKYQGEHSLFLDNDSNVNYIVHLRDGELTVNIELPESAALGDEYHYHFEIKDTNIDNVFPIDFYVKVIDYVETQGGGGKIVPPNSDKEGKGAIAPSGIQIPNVIEVTKDRWEEHNFSKFSALNVKNLNGVYDFFVNMDNIHLQTEIKPIARNDGKLKLLKARYKYAMVLIGLGVLGYYDNHKDNENESEINPEEMSRKISEMMSPILLPMIDVMGDDMKDIIGT